MLDRINTRYTRNAWCDSSKGMGYSVSEADESIRRQILAERAKNKMDAGDYKGAYELICSSISDIEYSDEVIHATLARLQNKQFRYHHDCSSFIILNEWLESQGFY